MTVFSASGRLQSRQHDRYLALQYAKERIEEARLVLGQQGVSGLTSEAFPDDQPQGTNRFQRSITFTQVSSRLVDVVVAVTYPNGQVRLRTRLLEM
jgi:hypothetical protein